MNTPRARFPISPVAAALLLAVVTPALAGATTAETNPGPVFSTLDTDRDGQLSPQEFRAGYAALQKAIAIELRLREQFRTVDTDGSGALDTGEYSRLVLVQQAGAAAPPLATFDADRSGGLGFAEYVDAVRALAAGAAKAPPPAATRPAPAAGAAS
jgi:hypothetical protein